jgi:LacI family transcriptional regulator
MARKAAFEHCMQEIGLKVSPELVAGDHTMEGGMRALVTLAGFKDRPTAVLCSNDMTAIGIMREAYDAGIAVPRELSVVGFDDIRLAQFMIPPLTTVQMSQAELARLAFDALVHGMDRSASADRALEFMLKTSLVLRRSTALAAEPKRAVASRKT